MQSSSPFSVNTHRTEQTVTKSKLYLQAAGWPHTHTHTQSDWALVCVFFSKLTFMSETKTLRVKRGGGRGEGKWGRQSEFPCHFLSGCLLQQCVLLTSMHLHVHAAVCHSPSISTCLSVNESASVLFWYDWRVNLGPLLFFPKAATFSAPPATQDFFFSVLFVSLSCCKINCSLETDIVESDVKYMCVASWQHMSRSCDTAPVTVTFNAGANSAEVITQLID